MPGIALGKEHGRRARAASGFRRATALETGPRLSPMLARMNPKPSGATLYVVGDVHGHWRDADRRFLESAGADLAMFVGDLGDEDVTMTQRIAAIECRKVVLLGNHDAWQSFQQKRPSSKLTHILAALGDDHLAYGVHECYAGGVSVIGARPFSWGGKSLRSPELYRALYGVGTHAESAQKIVEAARRAEHRDLVVLCHNGPLGLSWAAPDIWGKDFGQPGGDWGDADLELALEQIAALGMRVRAVIGGHMHARLMYPRGGQRTRFVRRDGTLFCNAAVVPRVVGDGDAQLGHFLKLRLQGGQVIGQEEVWVDAEARIVRQTAAVAVELPRAS